MKKWIRKCSNLNNNPNCRKIIEYKNEKFYLLALSKNTLCRRCSQYKNNNPQFDKSPWNKGLTKETDERIKKYGNTYSLNYKNGKIKNNWKCMIGKCAYDIWLEKYGKEEADKRENKKNKKHSRSISNEGNPMFGKHHSIETIKKIFKHRKMTNIEKIIANLLDKNNIKYHFQFFISENKLCKSYDFKIKDKPIIIEVDGDFWHGGPSRKNYWKNVDTVIENDKLKDELAKRRGYEVIRFWESDIKNNIDVIEERIKYVLG
ncbi:MAG: hypothetical protein JETCAE03_32510 [Ignavibacteriaceae bacterium]|nr:MAG: hypothetical protein JETCAE03_32510 [Ignavibacteriaceae bacterium]